MNALQRTTIEKLYFAQYERLVAYASASLKNGPLAEEAVQETFQRACMYPESLCGSPNPEGWLMSALKNVICDIQKQQSMAVKLICECEAPSGKGIVPGTEDGNVDILYGDLAATEEYRLIREIALEGRSMLELARERGISVDACKKRVQRAREFLRRRLEEHHT